MNKTHENKLIDLYNLMINFPKQVPFHMGYWISYLGENNEITCNTVVCAAGSGALLLPSWEKLRLVRRLGFDANHFYLVYRRYKQYKALSAFLGITESESRYIFHPGKYRQLASRIKEKHVANHIEKVLKNHGVELEWEK